METTTAPAATEMRLADVLELFARARGRSGGADGLAEQVERVTLSPPVRSADYSSIAQRYYALAAGMLAVERCRQYLTTAPKPKAGSLGLRRGAIYTRFASTGDEQLARSERIAQVSEIELDFLWRAMLAHEASPQCIPDCRCKTPNRHTEHLRDPAAVRAWAEDIAELDAAIDRLDMDGIDLRTTAVRKE